MILPECRWTVGAASKRADSVVVNPHKWLGAAFDCSVYFVRDAEHLIRVMSTNPSYLQTAADAVVKNFRDWGIAARTSLPRAQALVPDSRAGRRGAAGAPAPRPRERASGSQAQVRATPDWRVLAPVSLQTVCVRHEPAGLTGDALDAHTRAGSTASTDRAWRT